MVRPYQEKDRQQVIQLWADVFRYTEAHNGPAVSLDRKLAQQDGLLFIAESEGRVLGTVMAGYDGHRGWIYSLAVAPEARGQGLGTALMCHAEAALSALGCPKINLQILADNQGVAAFYRKLGYSVEERVSMGKRLSSGT